MSLIGRGGILNDGFEELGTADVSNVAGAVDTFTLPDYVGDGTPNIVITTPVTVQTATVTIEGADATDLFVAGFCLTQVAATTVTNVVAATLASTVNNLSYIEAGLSVRSGTVLNVYRLLFVGDGTDLVVYAKKEF